jgi:hypothetical protein
MVVTEEIDGHPVEIRVEFADENIHLTCPCGNPEISVGISSPYNEKCDRCGRIYSAEYDIRVRLLVNYKLVAVIP